MSGNFSSTSENITLHDGHILSAKCRTRNGDWRDSSIDLDEFIGNENGTVHILRGDTPAFIGLSSRLKANLKSILVAYKGSFQWNGENFSETARGTLLRLHDGAVIVADLESRDKSIMQASLSLDERITNEDGHLIFG